jgi:uncharacterized protein YcbK (DUF882 family)
MSKYFKPEEFKQHARHGLPEVGYPKEWRETKLAKLCALLDIIREAAGSPVTISSGYRSPEYNRKIGGARNSQHVQGSAADIQCKGMTAAKLHALVLRLYQEGKLPGLGGLGQYPTFVHLDIRQGKRLARWSGSRL